MWLLGAESRFSHSIDEIGASLAQPILKPFADELNKLAGQLDDFAKSEDFAKIKAAVTEFATSAAKSLDDLIQNTDWSAFAEKASSAITQIKDDLAAMAKSAQTIGTVIGKVGDVASGGFHTLGVAVDKTVEAITKGEDATIGFAQKLADATGFGDKFKTSVEGVRAGLQSAGEEAGKQADGNLKAAAGAFDAAISRAQALADKAKQANDAFDSIGASLQDRLDQATGNLEAVEDRRFQKEIADITAAAKEAGKLGTQKFQQDLVNAKALHDLNMRQIEAEQRATAGGALGSTSSNTSTGGNFSGGGGGSPVFGGQFAGITLHQHFDGATIIGTGFDQVAEQIGPSMIKVLKKAQALATKPILGR